MKKDDWKKILGAWYKSSKLRKLKEKAMNKGIFSLSTNELLEEMNAIEDFILDLTPEERAEYDFIDDEGFGMSKMDININFSQVCVKWFFYLKKYELSEEYEICARIVKAIEYEKQEALRIMSVYFFAEQDENDEPLIDEIIKQSKIAMEESYNTLIKTNE